MAGAHLEKHRVHIPVTTLGGCLRRGAPSTARSAAAAGRSRTGRCRSSAGGSARHGGGGHRHRLAPALRDIRNGTKEPATREVLTSRLHQSPCKEYGSLLTRQM